MLEERIASMLKAVGIKWNLAGGKRIQPTEEDVEKALDEAARVLYNGKPGDRLDVAGLIIEKRPNGHDVYVYVGTYQ